MNFVRLNRSVSLRFKIFITSLLTALVVALGSTWLFSNAWVELARSYGLLSIKEKLSSIETSELELGSEEWSFRFVPSGTKKHEWVSSSPARWTEDTMMNLKNKVLTTNLKEGSFEVDLPHQGSMKKFFVVFSEPKLRKNQGWIMVAGTRDQIALEQLSPLAAPFFSFVFVALLIAAILSVLITRVLTKAYTALERTIEDINAGRLDDLNLPDTGDPSVVKITRAIRSLVETLQFKDNEIAKVSELAHNDPMTGIPNFRAYNDYVKQNLPHFKKLKNKVTVLAIIDLDFFKRVNDDHGHQVGDFVLKETAKALKGQMRHVKEDGSRLGDFCARYGGEEFVVIFNDVESDDIHVGPVRILEAIRDMPLNIPAEISNNKKAYSMNVTCSIGIAAWNNETHPDKDAWIKEADEALYFSKEGGRARVSAQKPEKQSWT